MRVPQFCSNITLRTLRTAHAFLHVKQVPARVYGWHGCVARSRRRRGAFMVAILRLFRQRHLARGRVIPLRGIRKWPSQNGNFEPNRPKLAHARNKVEGVHATPIPRTDSVLSTNIVQTRQAGNLLTVDIQTSFHLVIGILDMEVAPIQSANCADWPSKHLLLAS